MVGLKSQKLFQLINSRFLQKLGFSISRLSDLQKLYRTCDLINSHSGLNQRLYNLMELGKKYPNFPYIDYCIGKCLFEMRNRQAYESFNQYAEKRKQWLESTGLSALELEIIPTNIFSGALGNHLYLDGLLRLRDTLVKPNKLCYVNAPNLILTNPTLFLHFKHRLTEICLDKFVGNGILREVSLPDAFFTLIESKALHYDAWINVINQKCLGQRERFEIAESTNEVGIKYFNKIGLKKNDWHVVIHMREPRYGLWARQASKENFRNVDPKSYLAAIRKIIKLGGTVFRMGDSSMTKMPNIKGLIDYAHSQDKSPELDVFLGATAKFSIVTSSGYSSIPRVFGVPQVYTNMLNYSQYFVAESKDIFVPKKLKISSINRPLTVEESLTDFCGTTTGDHRYDKWDLAWENNHDSTILLAVEEMMARTLNNQHDPEFDYLKKKLDNQKINLAGSPMKFFASILTD